MEKYICLTPYKEIRGGEKSIYDYVKEGYSVPEKVIKYLKTTKPYVMSPGVYKHPFKENSTLLGPYLYYDGIKYCWDRDTWKYIKKYGLTLPKEFIDYVMSEAGTAYLQSCQESEESWSNVISGMKESKNMFCMLSNDAEDEDIKDF
ncbi:MAG: hypothetical protein HDT30_00895 [Clostridiales bacterium]|nr:hypothetical protein [Clostridiales bacterium]